MENSKKALVVLIACLVLASSLLVVPAFAVQPPVKTDTYFVGTIGQPRRVDPARAYDTASAELILNVYEPLVQFKDKKVLGTAASINVSEVGYSDLSQFEGVLAKSWTFVTDPDTNITSIIFEIDTTIDWQPWTAANGTTYYQKLRVTDVEYTFKRMLVQDMLGAPSWMIALPFTGYMFFDEIFETDPNAEQTVANLINNAIQVINDTHIKFNFLPNKAWPQVAMLQIFAESWGCIVNKDFCIENGCWDGKFEPGWSTKWRRKPSNAYSPLDVYYEGFSKYTKANSPVTTKGGAMCGTGPYLFTYWNKATMEWRADYWPDYRGGWNAPGTDKHSLRTIIVRGVPEWPTRKMMFLAGDFDSVAVPRANMFDLLKAGQKYEPVEGVRLYHSAPTLAMDAMSFVFEVNPHSPYRTKVAGTPKDDFFKDVHVRRAFAYALNFTKYLDEAYFGEGIQPHSWWVQGLQPAAAENTTLRGLKYNINLDKIKEEMAAAGYYNPTTGAWTEIETYLCYNLGNDQRKIACEMIRDTLFGVSGGKIKCNVVGLDWPVFLDYEEEMFMPVFFVGWLADFAHPDNWARPYMHKFGDFAYFQGYHDDYVSDLIDKAIVEPDEAKACLMYQELQYIFWRDVPSLPLIQTFGRRWERTWVRGWYYNQLAPGLYFYDLWKSTVTPENVDVSVTHSITGQVYKYNIIHVWHSETRVGYRGKTQVPGSYQKWITNWTISVTREDNNPNIGLLYVTIGLKRINSTDPNIYKYPNASWMFLAAGETGEFEGSWYEDGVALTIQAYIWEVGGEASPISGPGGTPVQDEDPTDNYIKWGNMDAKELVGDINGDGIVDIYDALGLAAAFGKRYGEKGYNPDANLSTVPDPKTGKQIIDIYDALKLSANFGKFVSAVYP
ncbi:MAG: ABC transporter substrate-binding protein [Candidatus Bathyarchaeia archaeon]